MAVDRHRYRHRGGMTSTEVQDGVIQGDGDGARWGRGRRRLHGVRAAPRQPHNDPGCWVRGGRRKGGGPVIVGTRAWAVRAGSGATRGGRLRACVTHGVRTNLNPASRTHGMVQRVANAEHHVEGGVIEAVGQRQPPGTGMEGRLLPPPIDHGTIRNGGYEMRPSERGSDGRRPLDPTHLLKVLLAAVMAVACLGLPARRQPPLPRQRHHLRPPPRPPSVRRRLPARS